MQMVGSPTQAYRLDGWSTSAGTQTLPLDGVAFDPQINWNPSGGYYVCSQAGFFWVSGQVNVSATTDAQYVIAEIFRNGFDPVLEGSLAVAPGNAAYGLAAVVTGIVQCNKGDQLALGFNCSTAGLSLNLGDGAFQNTMCVLPLG